ncbi:MAG: Nif3-like dinuclear metal center hexameric protein [Clostridia bacterium]|nr:Nif3-like dinuclear metal center hexameric protein [Clostridia bacterium]
MNIRSLSDALSARFPEKDRASFDFDGLQVCPDEGREVRRIVTALDVTRESVAAAIDSGADLLLTHHPILFSPVRTLDPASSMDADLATTLLKNSVALITLHTRFDAGLGGINDTLAEKLGLTCVTPFGTADEPTPLGRIGNLKMPLSPEEFAQEVGRVLGTHVLLTSGESPVLRTVVVGGAAGDYLEATLESDADAIVTGELSHHRRLLAAYRKKTVIEAGHFGSEIVFCEAAERVLLEIDPTLDVCAFSKTPHEVAILP